MTVPVAAAIDLLAGEPPAPWHPVVWTGRAQLARIVSRPTADLAPRDVGYRTPRWEHAGKAAAREALQLAAGAGGSAVLISTIFRIWRKGIR